jgi:hypothetical protein
MRGTRVNNPPPEWERIKDAEDGTPVWQHRGELVQVTTWEFGLLEYLALALNAFHDPKRPGLSVPSLLPVPGEGCAWTDFRNSA